MKKLIYLIALFLSVGIVGCEDDKEDNKDYEFVATGKLEEFTDGTFCQSFNYLLTTKNNEFHLDINSEIETKAELYKGEIVTVYGDLVPNVESECPPLVDVKKITKK